MGEANRPAFSLAGPVVDCLPMMRTIALVALVGLLGAPLAAWTAANCCDTPDCCKSGLCPMRAAPSKPAADGSEAEMHCHRAAGSGAPAQGTNCSANARCSHSAQQLHPAPQQRAVLPAAAGFVLPGPARATIAVIPVVFAPGFLSLPFQPPRLKA